MQSRLFAKKVIKTTGQGSILEAFGVTLEHFGYQMALQWRFCEGLKFLMQKRQRNKTEQKLSAGRGDPINLNGRKALRP